MIKNFVNIYKNKNKGFTLVEIIISLLIFALILLAVISFFLTINASNLKTTADREALENARRVLDEITYEIRSATSIYTPSTTANQLSLETSRYLPSGETDTFIDFFLCGSAVCLKKESQNPIALTSDSVHVANLTFSQISTGANPSVQVNLTVNYSNSSNPQNYSSISLTSTASVRSY